MSLRLAEAEGREGAAARGEGRPTVVATESLDEASERPSGQRADSPFQSGGTPLGKPAAVRGRAPALSSSWDRLNAYPLRPDSGVIGHSTAWSGFGRVEV